MKFTLKLRLIFRANQTERFKLQDVISTGIFFLCFADCFEQLQLSDGSDRYMLTASGGVRANIEVREKTSFKDYKNSPLRQVRPRGLMDMASVS